MIFDRIYEWERERDYVDTTSPPGPVETDENREEEKLKLANFFLQNIIIE